jgi:hypothetical protein
MQTRITNMRTKSQCIILLGINQDSVMLISSMVIISAAITLGTKLPTIFIISKVFTDRCQKQAYHHKGRAAIPTGRKRVQHRNANSFDPLYNEPRCYNCSNFGHIATECYLKHYKAESKTKYIAEQNVWRKKENSHCNFVLSVQKKKDPWYIDSGCSKHMSGDKENLITLSKSTSGNVTFGNNAPGNIRGTGMVSLSNGKGKAQNVLLVEGLKHNLLSVSQMCDKGCEVLFTAKDCKIKEVSSGKLVAKGVRT